MYLEVPRDPWTEIVPGLWMGGNQREIETDDGFDAVVTLCSDTAKWLPPPDGVTAIEAVCFDDTWMPEPDVVVDAAVRASAALRRGQTVLVRCAAGLNRSGLVVAATLILNGWTPAAAIERIRFKRDPYALDNNSFVDWLLEDAQHELRPYMGGRHGAAEEG